MWAATEMLGEDVIQVIKRADFVLVEGAFTTKLIDLRLFTEDWGIADHEKLMEEEMKTDEYRKLRSRIVIDSIRKGTVRKFIRH